LFFRIFIENIIASIPDFVNLKNGSFAAFFVIDINSCVKKAELDGNSLAKEPFFLYNINNGFWEAIGMRKNDQTGVLPCAISCHNPTDQ